MGKARVSYMGVKAHDTPPPLPLWSELERGSSQTRLKNGNWIVLNPMVPLVLNY